MAIVDTINSMYENVGEVYDTITNVDLPTNKNIENIPSTIRKSYLDIMNNGIDTIYDNWEKVNGTGTSLTLNNTEEAPMTIEYKGNTSQETTTGKNLFNIEGQYETGTGITLTKNDDGSFTLNGTANGNNFFRGISYLNEQHTISYKSSVANSNVIIRTRTGTPTAQTGIQDQLFVSSTSGKLTSSKQFDFTEISIVSGTTLNNFKIYIQLEKGASETNFEPYTNGASPNPNYPQDIHIVSGDNYINVCGKNLLNMFISHNAGFSTTIRGITFTLNENGSVTINGTNDNTGVSDFYVYGSWGATTTQLTTTENCTFSTSSTITNGNINAFIISGSTAVRTLQSTNASGLVPANTNITALVIRVVRGQTINNITLNLQLEKGSTATTYEEYKGASYPIYLPVENYLPNNATTQTINGITYTINEDKSIKINGTASGRADLWLYGSTTDTGNYVFIPKGNYTMNTANLNDGTMFLSFREKTAGVRYMTIQNNGLLDLLSQQDCYFYGIMLGVESGKTINNLTFYPQIEKGTKLNSYTPYGTTPIELCKIGNYQDYIFQNTTENPLYDSNLEEGQWYIHKEIGRVVLDGTENWIRSGNTSESFFCGALAGVSIPFEAKMGTASDSKTNYFVKGNKGSNAEVFDMYNGTDYYTTFALYLSTSRATDVTTFKNWLSTHNVEVYYVLNTPTYEKITGELLNQLEAIKKSYENQTNINQENNDLPFELEVGALKKSND